MTTKIYAQVYIKILVIFTFSGEKMGLGIKNSFSMAIMHIDTDQK